MCNTRSNIYLQTMKTYTLSVNTLMQKLTLECHDNCATCLGLILPIRWVTPPPNSCLKCFYWCHICIIFAFGLSSTMICLRVYLHNVELVLCWYIYIYSVLSSTAFTYSYVFMFAFSWSKWMWSDPNPFCASTSNSIYPNHMHSIECCQLSSLNPC